MCARDAATEAVELVPKTGEDAATEAVELVPPLAKRSSAFALRAGADLDFHGLGLRLKDKAILVDVWGGVPGGEAGCIIGESGAGKTSLLNALAAVWNSNLQPNFNVRI